MSVPLRRIVNFGEIPCNQIEENTVRSEATRETNLHASGETALEVEMKIDDHGNLELSQYTDGAYGNVLRHAFDLYGTAIKDITLPRAASLANCSAAILNEPLRKQLLLPSIGNWESDLVFFFVCCLMKSQAVELLTLQDTSAIELLSSLQSPVRTIKIKSGIVTASHLAELARITEKSLEVLDLTNVEVATADTFPNELRLFPNLKEIRAPALGSREEELRSLCPSLERIIVRPEQVIELDVSGLDIDDVSLEELCNKYPRLQRLDIRGCNEVSYLPVRLFHLIALDASGTRFSNRSLYDLQTKCPYLQELALHQCKEIDDFEGVTLKRLTHLELSEKYTEAERQQTFKMLRGRS